MEMSTFSRQILIVGLLMVICVFFGMELANRGMNRIDHPEAAGVSRSGQTVTSVPKQPEESRTTVDRDRVASTSAPAITNLSDSIGRANMDEETQIKQAEIITKDALINRVGNKTGELLQIVAYHGIKKVVSLFNVWME